MNSFETPQPTYVLLGGGTTGEAAAGILDAQPEALVYAGVVVTDSGSWSGKLRTMQLDPSGIDDRPAVGDLRRSSSALSAIPEAAAIFEYKLGTGATVDDIDQQGSRLLETIAGNNPRISADRAAKIIEDTSMLARKVSEQNKGNLRGLNLGHLVMTRLTIEHGDIDSATQETGDLLNTRGFVVPTTLESVQLVQQDGPFTITGEHIIDERAPLYPGDVTMSFSGSAPLNPRLRAPMLRAVAIGAGPGSVYSSGIPGLLAEGTAETLAEAQDRGALLAISGNLVNQKTGTSGWTADRYVETYEKYLAVGRRFDVVILNEDTANLDPERAVAFDRDYLDRNGYTVVATNLVRSEGATRQANDLIEVRADAVHDMGALGVAFVGHAALGRSKALANV